jgi:hypothetical protein
MMRQDFPPKQYFDSILATVQLFQAGFWPGFTGMIASEIWVGTVFLDLFWWPWCLCRKAEGSPCQSKQMHMNPTRFTWLLWWWQILPPAVRSATAAHTNEAAVVCSAVESGHDAVAEGKRQWLGRVS